MNTQSYLIVLSFILATLCSTTPALSQEEVLSSAKVGECSLTVEANTRWNTLRLRAHHPEGRNCLIGQDSVLAALNEACSEGGLLKFEGAFTSLSIGRLIDYPWLSQYLAVTAQKDKKWNAKRGKAVALDMNKYVSNVLSQQEVLTPIETALKKSGYRIAGVSVEKVLVGRLREVPQYAGDRAAGLFPYDAQVWFRLELVRNG